MFDGPAAQAAIVVHRLMNMQWHNVSQTVPHAIFSVLKIPILYHEPLRMGVQPKLKQFKQNIHVDFKMILRDH